MTSASHRPERGLLDTSVLIDIDRIPVEQLPREAAVPAVALAELAAGPHATGDASERARRQERLQATEAVFETIPFDAQAARAYGRVFAAVAATGRRARPRAIDLLIAATALAAGVPLFTRNPDDLEGLGELVEIVPID